LLMSHTKMRTATENNNLERKFDLRAYRKQKHTLVVQKCSTCISSIFLLQILELQECS
jgi:hypothetical protein